MSTAFIRRIDPIPEGDEDEVVSVTDLKEVPKKKQNRTSCKKLVYAFILVSGFVLVSLYALSLTTTESRTAPEPSPQSTEPANMQPRYTEQPSEPVCPTQPTSPGLHKREGEHSHPSRTSPRAQPARPRDQPTTPRAKAASPPPPGPSAFRAHPPSTPLRTPEPQRPPPASGRRSVSPPPMTFEELVELAQVERLNSPHTPGEKYEAVIADFEQNGQVDCVKIYTKIAALDSAEQNMPEEEKPSVRAVRSVAEAIAHRLCSGQSDPSASKRLIEVILPKIANALLSTEPMDSDRRNAAWKLILMDLEVLDLYYDLFNDETNKPAFRDEKIAEGFEAEYSAIYRVVNSLDDFRRAMQDFDDTRLFADMSELGDSPKDNLQLKLLIWDFSKFSLPFVTRLCFRWLRSELSDQFNQSVLSMHSTFKRHDTDSIIEAVNKVDTQLKELMRIGVGLLPEDRRTSLTWSLKVKEDSTAILAWVDEYYAHDRLCEVNLFGHLQSPLQSLLRNIIVIVMGETERFPDSVIHPYWRVVRSISSQVNLVEVCSFSRKFVSLLSVVADDARRLSEAQAFLGFRPNSFVEAELDSLADVSDETAPRPPQLTRAPSAQDNFRKKLRVLKSLYTQLKKNILIENRTGNSGGIQTFKFFAKVLKHSTNPERPNLIDLFPDCAQTLQRIQNLINRALASLTVADLDPSKFNQIFRLTNALLSQMLDWLQLHVRGYPNVRELQIDFDNLSRAIGAIEDPSEE